MLRPEARILVVEGDLSDFEELSNALESEGLIVATAHGAEDGFHQFKEHLPELVLFLQRSQFEQRSEVSSVLEVGPVRIDLDRHQVHVRGQLMMFPLKEFELLHALLIDSGKVISRSELIRRVWGENYVGDTKTLDVHIKRLRDKVEENSTAPTIIKTVRGLGYCFDPA